ncbi:MAG: DUF4293 family protein [Lacibacter sp.]
MIQRIQSIWLLLAGAASLATLKLSFYSNNNGKVVEPELTGSSNFLILLLAVAVALVAFAAIILYKNRKKQMQVTLLGLLLQVVVLVIYFVQVKNYEPGNFTLTSVVSFIIPVFFILAWLGIRKDDKLVKSMDRLR